MIALVAGEVAARTGDAVVVETASGVGYRVAVSTQTLAEVPGVGGEVSLLTHLIVRDDALSLYGFATELERSLFTMLIGVQSVGPKMALAALSGGTPSDLIAAIASGDTARLVAVPGIGKRTAERILVELRDSLAGGALTATGPDDLDVNGEISVHRGDDPRLLAREGLVGLGFTFEEAERLLASAKGDEPELLLQQALKAARA